VPRSGLGCAKTPAAAVTIFALGLLVGAAVRPSLPSLEAASAAPGVAEVRGTGSAPAEEPLAHRLDPGLIYPAEVLRVIDGDTFQARVRVWPGLDVDTKVRLRGIDAAELHARCSDELAKAQVARQALESILGEGGVAISQVGIDKYGGRVDAAVSTRTITDVSEAMLNGGWARRYSGGRRGTWCG
jgi:endonuclease YncB( thermonuclease family)